MSPLDSHRTEITTVADPIYLEIFKNLLLGEETGGSQALLGLVGKMCSKI